MLSPTETPSVARFLDIAEEGSSLRAYCRTALAGLEAVVGMGKVSRSGKSFGGIAAGRASADMARVQIVVADELAGFVAVAAM